MPSCPRPTVCRLTAAIIFCLAVLVALRVPAQQAARLRQLTADQTRILSRAREILTKAAIGEAEREVRLQVVKAVLTGIAIRPENDYP